MEQELGPALKNVVGWTRSSESGSHTSIRIRAAAIRIEIEKHNVAEAERELDCAGIR